VETPSPFPFGGWVVWSVFWLFSPPHPRHEKDVVGVVDFPVSGFCFFTHSTSPFLLEFLCFFFFPLGSFSFFFPVFFFTPGIFFCFVSFFFFFFVLNH